MSWGVCGGIEKPTNIRGMKMKFGEAIKTCWSKYAAFKGRAARSEFWWWQLFSTVALLAPDIVTLALPSAAHSLAWLVLVLVADVATFLPGISVTVRRLHDTDHSGWWYWFGFIPIIGWIGVLVFFVTKGTPGDNRFGPQAAIGVPTP